jgi:hypothetical protein
VTSRNIVVYIQERSLSDVKYALKVSHTTEILWHMDAPIQVRNLTIVMYAIGISHRAEV